MRLRSLVAVLGVVVAGYAEEYVPQSYGSAMHRKCNALCYSGLGAGRYVDGRCYVATIEKLSTTYDQWLTLNAKCQHFAQLYDGRMAHVKTYGLLQRLVKANVATKSSSGNKHQYFVGARQDPQSKCARGKCRADEFNQAERETHMKNWFWVDESGKHSDPVDASLFRFGEPNNNAYPGNMDESKGEYILALEDTSVEQGSSVSGSFGLNDIHPEADQYQLLCEYEDYMKCDPGYALIGDMCYKPSDSTDQKRYDEAQRKCQETSGGSLASIHNDEQNYHIARLALESRDFKATGSTNGMDGHFAYTIGMNVQPNPTDWFWSDNSRVDYVRWWLRTGNNDPVNFANGGKYHAVLRTAINQQNGEAAFGYWHVESDDTPRPYICQHPPRIIG